MCTKNKLSTLGNFKKNTQFVPLTVDCC